MSISPRPLKLVSNLPYSIATPVISNLFCTKHVPTRMAVTIQKELADRVVASPGTKDYGSLSVWVQSQAEAEIVRILPPTVFWPRPKVHSAFLRIDTNPAKRALLDPLEAFHTFVRAMFFHRRKFLRSVMLSAYKGELGKPEVDQIMLRQGLGPDSRAEQLNVQEMLALFHTTQQELAAHASSHSPIDGDKS